jgi:hypothetical protein
VSRAAQARRIATAAAYGGGGLGLLTAASWGLLFGEAKLARRWVGPPDAAPPAADGTYGHGTSGPPLTLAVLGDSSAAGLGVQDPLETPGVLVAAGLAEVADRRVRLVSAAVVGARSEHLASQVEQTRAAAIMLPSVCAALGVWPEEADAEVDRRLFVPDGVRPVAAAAVRAAAHPGSEVTGARVDGRERGPRGRWAFLRRRRPRAVTDRVDVRQGA